MNYNNKFVEQCALQELVRQEELNHLLDRRLSVKVFDRAVVVPRCCGGTTGAMYDHDGLLVPDSNIYDSPMSEWHGCPEVDDGDVLFLGAIFGTWGHCATDFLGRVWPLLGKRERLRVAFITTNSSGKIPDNYFALLEGVGLTRDRVLEVVRPTMFKRVLFPDTSFMYVKNGRFRGCTMEYVQTINAICAYYAKKIAPIPHRTDSIYLSRGKWSGGKTDFGEEVIESACRKTLDCMVLHPEEMTFREMFSVLWQCDTLITTDGSIGHNSLFVRPGTKIVLIRKVAHANGFQPVISQVKNLDVTYVDAHWSRFLANPNEPWLGPFFLLVNRRLADFLGCKPEYKKAILPFLQYFIAYLPRRGRVIASIVKWWFVSNFRRIMG